MNRRQLAIAIALLLAGAGASSFAASEPGNIQEAIQAANGGSFFSPLPEKVQEDIGDIRPESNAPLSSYFHVQATLNTQYTSNAPLYHSRDKADMITAPTIEANFDAPINKNFSVYLAARVEDYTYASHQSLGFWGFSGNAELEYHYKPAWPRIYAGTEPYYYFTYANGNRLTTALGPVAGVDQNVELNRGKTLLYMGYQFGDYLSSPGIDTRQSHAVTISLTQQLRSDLYAQGYWQFQYSDYTTFGRDEVRDVIGGSLIHQFTPQTFASFFVNYVDNASNNSLAKYTTVDAGVNLVLQY